LKSPSEVVREALSDPSLLGTAIAGNSWRSWRTLLIAAMGEKLSEDEREIFTELTGREREPLQRVDEFAAVIGRRGGKSKSIATLATYIAGLCDHGDSESTLADHIKAFERLAPRAGIPPEKLKTAISAIRSRISEIDESAEEASPPDFSGNRGTPADVYFGRGQTIRCLLRARFKQPKGTLTPIDVAVHEARAPARRGPM
jgi:hypothetical protein